MDIYEVTETYTKTYFVAGTEEESLSHCNDSSIDPAPQFIEGCTRKISHGDIKQASMHQGDDEYILWNAKGEELNWIDFVTN